MMVSHGDWLKALTLSLFLWSKSILYTVFLVYAFMNTFIISVCTISYRLAPEHIFPAGLDDCVIATKYFLNNAADFGVDAGRIGIGGLAKFSA